MAEHNTEGQPTNVVPFNLATPRRVAALTESEILALRRLLSQMGKIASHCPTARHILSED